MNAITFSAMVYKVQNLVDGGLRVTLDLPEDAIPQAAMLLETRREGIPLMFTATVEGEPAIRRKSGDSARPKKR